jgi:uncharacterized SAM-dependent methyltransferase
VLTRINDEVSGNFDLGAFEGEAVYRQDIKSDSLPIIHQATNKEATA